MTLVTKGLIRASTVVGASRLRVNMNVLEDGVVDWIDLAEG